MHVKQIRLALGMSADDTAVLLGLDQEGGGKAVEAIEQGKKPISGPLSKLILHLMQAIPTDVNSQDLDDLDEFLPPMLECRDLSVVDPAAPCNLVYHTRWPRFLAFVEPEMDAEKASVAFSEDMAANKVMMMEFPKDSGLGMFFVTFIDDPSANIDRAMKCVNDAAVLKYDQAMRRRV